MEYEYQGLEYRFTYGLDRITDDVFYYKPIKDYWGQITGTERVHTDKLRNTTDRLGSITNQTNQSG